MPSTDMQIGIAGITRNRKGRKRKSGRRTASGDIARKPVDYRAMAAEWPHRRTLPEAVRSSELGENEIGRLHLRKRISESQREAGREFSRIVEAHRSAISAPRGSVGNGQGKDCNPAKCDPCHCERRMKRYRAATTALQLKGQAVYNVTYRTAVSDEPCQDYEIDDLRTGLGALARHLGI